AVLADPEVAADNPGAGRCSQRGGAMFEVAVDIGGTFTDLAVYDLQNGAMEFGKVLTTPADPSLGVRDALDASAVRLAESSAFIHGTTVAINTVIEHTGARTA